VMFAIELMMPEVSVRTFLPVALATVGRPLQRSLLRAHASPGRPFCK
jgi:hypothetical protein